jgi:hypothetical protein
MRFAHEMNGTWYPWSEQENGNSTGQYATAWQHVYNTFTAICTNAKWVWCPITDFSGSTPLTGLYPGDAYVDWVGLDVYNQGTDGSGGGWQPFTNIVTTAYNTITGLTSKPMLIGEMSSSEMGGTKNDWITNALTNEIYNFPAIQQWIWFNYTSTPNWWIESSVNTTTAFRLAVQSSPQITYGPTMVPNRSVGPVVLRKRFRQPYIPQYNAAALVNASIAQIAASITFTGGTQATTVTVTQSAATVTFTGGTQTVATVNIVAIAQVAATITFAGGTQVVATTRLVQIAQSAATITFNGGTQAVASSQKVSITQSAATVTFTGGTQTVAANRLVNITQSAATITFTGGTQVLVDFATVAQLAATWTFTGGHQAVQGLTPVNWVPIKVTISSGFKTNTVASGQKIAEISSGGRISSVPSGTKTGAVQAGDDDITITSGNKKANL